MPRNVIFTSLDFDVTASIPPALRHQLEKVQANVRRAKKASSRRRNSSRAVAHYRRAFRLLSKYSHLFALLPAEAFTTEPLPVQEPSYYESQLPLTPQSGQTDSKRN